MLELSKENKIDLIYYRYKNDPYYIAPNANVNVLKVCNNSTLIKLFHVLLFPFVHPLFSIRFSWLLLFRIFIQLKKKNYDLIYLDHSQMFLYGKFISNHRKILMSHDVMIQRYSRKKELFQQIIIGKSESWVLKMNNAVIFTFSDKDRDLVFKYYGLQSEVTHFYLDVNNENAMPCVISKTLVFFGKWKRKDNYEGLYWFFNTVYPLIKEFGYKYVIIGAGLDHNFATHFVDKNIEYMGFVDNPYNIISNSLAMISPLFSGAGVKVKVVESLACGTPVIGTKIAFEGIDARFSDFMLEVQEPSSYIEQIQNLNISLGKRIEFKRRFISQYRKYSLANYINSTL